MEEKLGQMDLVEAELFTQARLRYANPGLIDTEAARMARLPGGLYVTRANPGAKLQPGDLVVTIDGQPALPQTLQRVRFAPVPAQMKVRRASGEFTELIWP